MFLDGTTPGEGQAPLALASRLPRHGGMKPIAVVVLFVMLALAPRAHAQPLVLTLVPSQQEIAEAHRQADRGRSIFIAGAVTHGLGLVLTVATVFGAFGNRDGLIAGGSSALILGTTSLVLMPVGGAIWAKGAKRERILRGGVLVF
jgi:hypothetical protein